MNRYGIRYYDAKGHFIPREQCVYAIRSEFTLTHIVKPSEIGLVHSGRLPAPRSSENKYISSSLSLSLSRAPITIRCCRRFSSRVERVLCVYLCEIIPPGVFSCDLRSSLLLWCFYFEYRVGTRNIRFQDTSTSPLHHLKPTGSGQRI